MKTPFEEYLEKYNYSCFNLKAVLFDMDGVLFDSMKWHAKSWKQTMDKFNLPTEENEFYLYEGMVGRNTIQYIIEREENRTPNDHEIEIIYKEKSDSFAKMNDRSLIPFAYEMVEKVVGFGLDCTLVTGSGQSTLLKLMEDKFGKFFPKERMVTAWDVKYGKPHPEPYLMGLDKSGGLAPNEAIVIENAPRGVEAAVAAGIFTIAINTGPLDPNILKESGADIVLPSMQKLVELFDGYYQIMETISI